MKGVWHSQLEETAGAAFILRWGKIHNLLLKLSFPHQMLYCWHECTQNVSHATSNLVYKKLQLLQLPLKSETAVCNCFQPNIKLTLKFDLAQKTAGEEEGDLNIRSEGTCNTVYTKHSSAVIYKPKRFECWQRWGGFSILHICLNS